MPMLVRAITFLYIEFSPLLLTTTLFIVYIAPEETRLLSKKFCSIHLPPSIKYHKFIYLSDEDKFKSDIFIFTNILLQASTILLFLVCLPCRQTHGMHLEEEGQVRIEEGE